MNIEAKRENEQKKYAALTDPSKNYGNGLFGEGALPAVADYAPESLVDLGCGQNLFTKRVRELLPTTQTVGVDIAFPQADVNASMHDTGLPDSAFDIVTAFDSLEHVLPVDIGAVFTEMKRIAKPGGMFIVAVSYVASIRRSLGQPLHLSVHPESWWLTEFGKVANTIQKRGRYITGSFK